MLGLIISLQGLAVIAFFFGAFNASKGLKMFSEDYGAPQGYLMCIGGALAGVSATCLCPLNQWESFFGLLVLSAVVSE